MVMEWMKTPKAWYDLILFFTCCILNYTLKAATQMLIAGLLLSRQYEIPWRFPDFSEDHNKALQWVWDHFGGLGACSPWKFLKLGSSTWLKMNFRQQNSLTFPWRLEFCLKFSDFLGKFPDFEKSRWNSLTFPGFQVFQVSGNPVIV